MLCVLSLDFILISPLNSYSHKTRFYFALIASELKDLSNILLKRAGHSPGNREHMLAGGNREHMLAGGNREHMLAGGNREHMLAGGNREHMLAGIWYYIELASRPPRQHDAISSSPAECAPEHTHCGWPSSQHCSTTE